MSKTNKLLMVIAIILPWQSGFSQDLPDPDVETHRGATNHSNGILDPAETIDTTVMQSHMNTDIDPSDLMLSSYSIRDYISTQVESLKYIGSEKDAFVTWALPLTSHRQTSHLVTKVIRYNIERKKVPKYRRKYKYVKKYIYVREGGSSADSSGYGKRKRTGKLVKRRVTERQLVSVRQVGFETKKVRVPHPEGKYEDTVQMRVTENVGIAEMPHGWHALNAQPIFSMLKAGINKDDPQILMTVRTISNLLYAYGIPDNTIDVAWLTAVYTNLPQERPDIKYWTERLVSRLISGASQEKENQGMWGPICINSEFSDEIAKYDDKFIKRYITPLENDLRVETRERQKNNLTAKLNSLNEIYEKWQKVYLTWAMSGNAVNNPRLSNLFPARDEGQLEHTFNYSLKASGLSYDPYHFEFTDLESTAIALFALNEAYSNKLLPKQTLVPLDHKEKTLGKPLNTQKQLRACLNSISYLRNKKTGGWNSCNHAEFNNECRNIPYTSIIPKNIFDTMTQEEHWAYNVMGVSSMEYLGNMLGGLQKKKVEKHLSEYKEQLIQWMLENIDQLQIDDINGKVNLTYHLAGLMNGKSANAQFLRQELGSLLYEEIADAADLDMVDRYHPHIVDKAIDAEREYLKVSKDPPEAKAMEAVSSITALDSMHLKYIANISKRSAFVYFLSKTIREPLFVSVVTTDQTEMKGLEYFIENKGVGYNHFNVESIDEIAKYSAAFYLTISTNDEFALSDDNKLKLEEYMNQHNGTVVILCEAGVGATKIEEKLATLFKNRETKVEQATTFNRGSKCIEFHSEGSLSCIIVDASEVERAGEMYKSRLKVYESLLKEKLPSDYLKSSYSLLPGHQSNGELKLTGVEWETAP